jgi:Domain of unknown function (DUF6265)
MKSIGRIPIARRAAAVALVALATFPLAQAQAPASPSPPGATSMPADVAKRAATPIDTASLAPLAWLDGCWRGAVNQREFREHWMPLRGGMMLGVGQTVMADKTQDYDYLRLETRADGVYYIIIPSEKKAAEFRLTTAVNDDNGSEFTFVNRVDAFPQRVVYRRAAEGWLYASIEGKLDGEDRRATFPYRRVDCATGEPIRK